MGLIVWRFNEKEYRSQDMNMLLIICINRYNLDLDILRKVIRLWGPRHRRSCGSA